MLKQLSLIALLLCMYSCAKNGMVIKPVDAEMNKKFLTGEGLDLRLFSTKDIFQYYKIDNYTYIKEKELAGKLNAYIQNKYLDAANTKIPETLTILFYRENSFSNYGDGIFTAARDNESGMIDDEDDNLIARSRITHIAGNRLQRYTVIYDKDKILLETTDTVPTK